MRNILNDYISLFKRSGLSGVIITMCFIQNVVAQNQPMYSQYIFNTLPINPAYAGSQENLSLTSLYRHQWIDINGAPSTMTLSMHTPLKKRKIALGFTAINDNIGVTDRTGVYGIYAYRIQVTEKSKLSFGLQGGVSRMVMKLSQLQTKMPNDPTVGMDRTIYTLPDFGAGLYWYSEKYYIGASIPDLLGIKLKNYSDQSISYRHFFFHAGGVFPISYQVKYMAGILIKDVKGTGMQYDINNFIILNDVLYTGISYRSQTSLNFLLQLQVTNQLLIGYSYDYPYGRFSSLAGASHELKLSYKFVFLKDNTFMPRYF